MTVQRVGVIGGGQLAWMMALEAKQLEIPLVVQTPKVTDPAVAIAAASILAPVADPLGTKSLAERCQVITFENEFIDLDALKPLEAAGVQFYPRLSALDPLLDKSRQRQFLAAHGLPNPPYVHLEDTVAPDAIAAIAAQVGWPLVMKTCRLGYDGQGTFILASAAALTTTWQSLGRPPVLLEAFVPFQKELAVIVARASNGDIAVYPVVETQQVDQVCRRVIAPATIPDTVRSQVSAIAHTIVEQLAYVGVLAIELFLTDTDQVLVNEIAPRTHNSGHYTLDACETSQFAQQLRAVTGQPLGRPDLTCDRALMVNLLGFEAATSDYAKQRAHLAQIPQARVYWYGKRQARPGRKLGHVTVRLSATDDWSAIAHQIETRWYPPSQS